MAATGFPYLLTSLCWIIVLFTVFSQNDGALVPCAEDKWFSFGDSCYMLVGENDNDMMDWHGAETYCSEKGGHLVSIHSKEENEFVGQMAKSKFILSFKVWIGLHALGLDDQLRWSDGSQYNFVNWAPDKREGFQQEKCNILHKYQGTWQDELCGIPLPFICKKPNGTSPRRPTTAPPPPVSGYCPDGWHEFGNKCYQVNGASSHQRKDWDTAHQLCREGGKKQDLVSIHSLEEQNFLISLLGIYNTSVWIGLRRIRQYVVHAWSDNSKVDFTNWPATTISHDFWRIGMCVEMTSDSFQVGKWYNLPCDTLHGYICQRYKDRRLHPPEKQASICPEGFTQYRSSCFRFINQNLAWLEAESRCQEEGGHLASVADVYEYAFLFNYLRTFNPDNQSTWIGLSENQETHSFEWKDTWPVIYSRWGPGQPESENGTKNCVTFEENTSWSMTNCDEKHAVLCKTSKVKPPEPHDDLQPFAGECPFSESVSWIDLGGRYCYHINTGASYTWSDAALKCNELGPTVYLASIHSKTELDLLLYTIGTENLKAGLWIGLIQMHDGSYAWYDGTPLSFEYWGTNHSPRPDTLCVSLDPRDYRWIKEQCAYEYRGYICKTEKVPLNGSEVDTSTDSSQREIAVPKECKTVAKEVVIAVSITTFIAFVGIVVGLYHFTTKPARTNAPGTVRKESTKNLVHNEPQNANVETSFAQ